MHDFVFGDLHREDHIVHIVVIQLKVVVLRHERKSLPHELRERALAAAIDGVGLADRGVADGLSARDEALRHEAVRVPVGVAVRVRLAVDAFANAPVLGLVRAVEERVLHVELLGHEVLGWPEQVPRHGERAPLRLGREDPEVSADGRHDTADFPRKVGRVVHNSAAVVPSPRLVHTLVHQKGLLGRLAAGAVPHLGVEGLGTVGGRHKVDHKVVPVHKRLGGVVPQLGERRGGGCADDLPVGGVAVGGGIAGPAIAEKDGRAPTGLGDACKAGLHLDLDLQTLDLPGATVLNTAARGEAGAALGKEGGNLRLNEDLKTQGTETLGNLREGGGLPSARPTGENDALEEVLGDNPGWMHDGTGWDGVSFNC